MKKFVRSLFLLALVPIVFSCSPDGESVTKSSVSQDEVTNGTEAISEPGEQTRSGFATTNPAPEAAGNIQYSDIEPSAAASAGVSSTDTSASSTTDTSASGTSNCSASSTTSSSASGTTNCSATAGASSSASASAGGGDSAAAGGGDSATGGDGDSAIGGGSGPGGPLPNSDADGAPGSPRDALFHLPPPHATALKTIDREILLRPFDSTVYLRDVADRFDEALEQNGYDEERYLAVDYYDRGLLPDAFAIVTRVEQINADGSPKEGDERYKLNVEPLHGFSLRELLYSLIGSDPGYYRVTVFVVTRKEFNESEDTVTRSQASDWLRSGWNALPKKIGDHKYTEDHETTALIYEFKQPTGEGEAFLMRPGEPESALQHLQKAGIWTDFSDE